MGFLNAVDSFVWGLPLMTLLLGTGLYLTILLRGIQFTWLFPALYLALVKRTEGDAKGDISHFQALMTALSATVGVGNIAGVATAIALGGPGAVFWMWITGLLGMATKYAEAVLAVKYRYVDENGNMVGGPMVYICAIGDNPAWKALAVAFALFASLAAFGIGDMAQSNTVAEALESSFGVSRVTTGVTLAILTAAVILGGIKWIGRACSVIAPVMIFFYCTASIWALLLTMDKIPGTIATIIFHAFTPSAAIGGFAGASVWMAARMGLARGIFSNESGLGSAPIAAAAAKTNDPVAQALVSMTQTFIDTLVVCTMTALVILNSGAMESGLTGVKLSYKAYSLILPGGYGEMVVAISVALFAYSTLIGWSYYGEKAMEWLIGVKAILPYRIVFCVLTAVGAMLNLETVWTFSDIANGLMAFPNLVALVMLSPVIAAETKRYVTMKAGSKRKF
jgi:AGCS family alanine or glycine:cation symporter